MSHRKSGFTIIELMLSMSFIAILLIAVAMTTIQISNIYTKGITLREVNQAGRRITDELQRGIAASVPFDVVPGTTTSKYVVRDGGGRLCLGAYTYAWNYGKAFVGAMGGIYNKYNAGDTTQIRFVKVADASGALCSDPTLNIPKDQANEVLASGDRDLVLHNFNIVRTQDDASFGQSLYAISFTIGTNDREQLVTGDASCKPPGEGVGDENYCSVNQFEIVARAGNASGGN